MQICNGGLENTTFWGPIFSLCGVEALFQGHKQEKPSQISRKEPIKV